MDLVKYEKFEDWLTVLKATDKQTIVYVDIIHVKPNETMRSINILFQVEKDGKVHSCVVDEEMPGVTVVPAWVFDVLSTEKLRAEALADYNHTLDAYDVLVDAEYKKACGIIKNQGYQNVVMGLIQ